ncbi:NYN domain-containing protein [Caulobacter vibrioides]|uniref:NYN domain-containing protein n=1 Tax=Caulobacter vibrioides TaxID=155892 RepID=A0A290MMM6_CAUVI|nr:NYN domain-containing protein [Caulobacter vibrioides]ATC33025.1 NYN domain-containing protein [Caulobacter vibrioides]
MTTYVYVDNSNIFIEGRRLSAVKKGLAKSVYEAMASGIVDPAWNLDYGKLYQFLCGGDAIARLWGSPPPHDSFWSMLERKGFQTTVYDKNFANHEKKVDVAIGARMTKDAYTVIDKAKDELLLVSGDNDFVPVVADLVSEGFKVEVAFWSHAGREIADVASRFIPLDAYHDHFSR